MDELTIQEHKSLLSELQEIVKCPVCFNALQAPVSQCSNGHIICSECYAQVRNCPVCRTNFISAKNRVLEDILNLIPHSCKHQNCEIFVKPKDDHEKWCGMQPTKCRICDWSDFAKNLPSHVKQCHEHILIPVKKQMTIQSFNQSSTCIMAFFAQDQFFWIERKNYVLNHMCTIKYLLIPNGEIFSSFEMQFVMENEQNKLVVSTKLNKESVLSTDTKFNSFSFPSSVFEEFLNENQEIKYKLNLVRN